MKRSCQRHTQVFDLPVRRMISLVLTPSALNSTISARQTCLCGVLRSRASTFRRRRSAGLRVMEIPVRMRQTRMHRVRWESPPGFKCQTQSTRYWTQQILEQSMEQFPHYELDSAVQAVSLLCPNRNLLKKFYPRRSVMCSRLEFSC